MLKEKVELGGIPPLYIYLDLRPGRMFCLFGSLTMFLVKRAVSQKKRSNGQVVHFSMF